MGRLLAHRRLVTGAALILAAIPAIFFGFHLYPRHGADRVKHLIDWDDSCASVEMETARRSETGYSAHWRSTVEVARMACEHLGDTAFYARFPTATVRRREVSAWPPTFRACDVPPGVIVYDGRVKASAFRRRCARKHGSLREGTVRYCAAGPEVVVDGFYEDRDFRELCAKLKGHLAQAPKALATR